MKPIKDITYRNIAMMLVKAMPVDGEQFTDKVSEYTAIIQAMPIEHKLALRSAYIFSAKVPREEREDMFQELAIALLENGTKSPALAYSIARCDWRNWWSKYKIRQHYSLDTVVNDSDDTLATFGELVIGECDFDIRMNSEIECQRIVKMLPDKLKRVVKMTLLGQMVSPWDRLELQQWGIKHAMSLVEA